MKYTIVRTDTADICIRKIVTFIARNFGEDIALKKIRWFRKEYLSVGR